MQIRAGGHFTFPMPREAVWSALFDPDVLKSTLKGCQGFEKTDEKSFVFCITHAVGPMKGSFEGHLDISEIVPLKHFTLQGSGEAKGIGTLSGTFNVGLVEEGQQTVLTYSACAQVGGNIKSLGEAIVLEAAQKFADESFKRFLRHFNFEELQEPPHPGETGASHVLASGVASRQSLPRIDPMDVILPSIINMRNAIMVVSAIVIIMMLSLYFT